MRCRRGEFKTSFPRSTLLPPIPLTPPTSPLNTRVPSSSFFFLCIAIMSGVPGANVDPSGHTGLPDGMLKFFHPKQPYPAELKDLMAQLCYAIENKRPPQTPALVSLLNAISEKQAMLSADPNDRHIFVVRTEFEEQDDGQFVEVSRVQLRLLPPQPPSTTPHHAQHVQPQKTFTPAAQTLFAPTALPTTRTTTAASTAGTTGRTGWTAATANKNVASGPQDSSRTRKRKQQVWMPQSPRDDKSEQGLSRKATLGPSCSPKRQKVENQGSQAKKAGDVAKQTRSGVQGSSSKKEKAKTTAPHDDGSTTTTSPSTALASNRRKGPSARPGPVATPSQATSQAMISPSSSTTRSLRSAQPAVTTSSQSIKGSPTLTLATPATSTNLSKKSNSRSLGTRPTQGSTKVRAPRLSPRKPASLATMSQESPVRLSSDRKRGTLLKTPPSLRALPKTPMLTATIPMPIIPYSRTDGFSDILPFVGGQQRSPKRATTSNLNSSSNVRSAMPALTAGTASHESSESVSLIHGGVKSSTLAASGGGVTLPILAGDAAISVSPTQNKSGNLKNSKDTRGVAERAVSRVPSPVLEVEEVDFTDLFGASDEEYDEEEEKEKDEGNSEELVRQLQIGLAELRKVNTVIAKTEVEVPEKDVEDEYVDDDALGAELELGMFELLGDSNEKVDKKEQESSSSVNENKSDDDSSEESKSESESDSETLEDEY
ncbi:hypothetical protein BDY19DRAFT_456508 [Irpex rosettiformis]|uniref:Uncharacterized protein n=1 Tax=Irpex rosettiformis TaxID=378272 RepID=A0ACB8TTG6_9APHY|nr:hypothetical protein BDY19DRAFT_456508 [Irpex rosettiformis]